MSGVGVIGFGRIGSVIVQRLLLTGMVAPSEMYVSTKTSAKLVALKEQWPAVRVATSEEVARASSLVFLSIGTFALKDVLDEIGASLAPTTHLVSVCGGVEAATIERAYSGAVSRAIPTVLAEKGAGVTLASHGSRVSAPQRDYLERLLLALGELVIVKHEEIDDAALLSSCAPAWIAYVCQQCVRAGTGGTILDHDVAAQLVLATLVRTATLLERGELSAEHLVRQAVTPGGPTGEGLRVLSARVPNMLAELFAAARESTQTRILRTRRQFESSAGPRAESQAAG